MLKRFAVVVALLAAVAMAAVLILPSGTSPPAQPPSPPVTLGPARAAAKAGHWDTAATRAAAFLRDRPRDPQALLLAGEAAAKRDRFVEAIRHYDAVPDTAVVDAAVARLCSGDVRLRLGRLTEAERDFRLALELDPAQSRARSRLAIVLMLSGRRWEAGPYLFELVRRDEAGLDDLCALGDPARLLTNDEQLARFRDLAPRDPLPALGIAARLQCIEEAGLLQNDAGRFSDAASAAGAYFKMRVLGRGAASADFDNDGDIDLAISHLDHPLALLANKSDAAGPFVGFELMTADRLPPVGGKIEVEASGRRWVLTVVAGGSYLSSNDGLLFVGLGTADEPVAIEVFWPSGEITRCEGLKANSYWRIYESGRVLGKPDSGGSTPRFLNVRRNRAFSSL